MQEKLETFAIMAIWWALRIEFLDTKIVGRDFGYQLVLIGQI